MPGGYAAYALNRLRPTLYATTEGATYQSRIREAQALIAGKL